MIPLVKTNHVGVPPLMETPTWLLFLLAQCLVDILISVAGLIPLLLWDM